MRFSVLKSSSARDNAIQHRKLRAMLVRFFQRGQSLALYQAIFVASLSRASSDAGQINMSSLDALRLFGTKLSSALKLFCHASVQAKRLLCRLVFLSIAASVLISAFLARFLLSLDQPASDRCLCPVPTLLMTLLTSHYVTASHYVTLQLIHLPYTSIKRMTKNSLHYVFKFHLNIYSRKNWLQRVLKLLLNHIYGLQTRRAVNFWCLEENLGSSC